MDSEVGFACFFFACPSHAVSPTPGLVKLLALSNFPAYVQFVRVSQNIPASVVFCFVILNVVGASLSLVGAPLVGYQVSRTQWLLCADPPFTCTIDDATPEWIFRL